ncbi:MAG: adenylyl-sulfate kinase [Candidatus Aminicenantaceae bacterium]|jgi:adenylylsulfate kinase
MTIQKATNITWHDGAITKSDRERLIQQKGVVIWFTGLSSSGKSTIARAVEERLFERGHLSYVLDGDNIRHGLNKNLGFSPEDREENIRRIGEVAKLFADAGFVTMTAFISPYRKDRNRNRELLQKGEFIEVFVKVSLDVAEERDPKGLYKKARAGEIKEFTGISAPYEEPLNPELILDTDKLGLTQCQDAVIRYLVENGIISANEKG